MKKLIKLSVICLFFAILSTPITAQSNQVLDEIRSLCTELTVISSQVGADAHKVIVFGNNGNAKQQDRAVNDVEGGLNDVIEGLGRLRRIANGIISNQRYDGGGAYRRSASSLSNDLAGNTRLPREKSEVAGEVVSLMGMIKNLSQEIRQEVVQMKNSGN